MNDDVYDIYIRAGDGADYANPDQQLVACRALGANRVLGTEGHVWIDLDDDNRDGWAGLMERLGSGSIAGFITWRFGQMTAGVGDADELQIAVAKSNRRGGLWALSEDPGMFGRAVDLNKPLERMHVTNHMFAVHLAKELDEARRQLRL